MAPNSKTFRNPSANSRPKVKTLSVFANPFCAGDGGGEGLSFRGLAEDRAAGRRTNGVHRVQRYIRVRITSTRITYTVCPV